MLSLAACCQAAEPVEPKPQAAVESAARPVPPKPPKRVLRSEAEVSALTSETSDQFYTRLNLRQTGGPSTWFLRAGYSTTKTRTYSHEKTYETDVSTYTLDGQYRTDQSRAYRFVSASAKIRDRSPYTITYGDKTGYYLLSGGYGTNLLPGLDGELALGHVATYDEETDSKMTVVSSLRWTNEITDSMSWAGHAYLIQPFSGDVLIDSRTDLTYKFTPALSLRFTYVANNLVQPIRTRSGWDRSFRVSLVFTHATK